MLFRDNFSGQEQDAIRLLQPLRGNADFGLAALQVSRIAAQRSTISGTRIFFLVTSQYSLNRVQNYTAGGPNEHFIIRYFLKGATSEN